MRGVRMNTLGWFDFKSAWFSPPELPSDSHVHELTVSTGCEKPR